MDAFQILVIILSSILALCLIVALIAGIMLVAVLKQIKHIAEKAAAVADNVETASEFFKNTSISGAAFKFVSNAVDMFKHKNDKKGKNQ